MNEAGTYYSLYCTVRWRYIIKFFIIHLLFIKRDIYVYSPIKPTGSVWNMYSVCEMYVKCINIDIGTVPVHIAHKLTRHVPARCVADAWVA
jgi:hypothetical protein